MSPFAKKRARSIFKLASILLFSQPVLYHGNSTRLHDNRMSRLQADNVSITIFPTVF